MTIGAEHCQNFAAIEFTGICPFMSEISLTCLFLWFASHSKIFHSFVEVTITGKGLQILTYARHLWPLRSEGSLTCHTYCDTDRPFITVISEGPWHSPVAERLVVKLSLPDLNPDPPHTRRTLYHYTMAAVTILEMVVNNQSVNYNISIIDYFFVISCEN